MRNWSTDTTAFNRNSPLYHRWKLEQLINFGLQNEKLNRAHLRLHIETLVIDPAKKLFLKFILNNAKAN